MKWLSVLILLAGPAPLVGQETTLPPIAAAGFQAIVAQGPGAALDTWTAAWDTQEDLSRQAQMKLVLEQIWSAIGPATGYDIVRTVPLGAHLVDVYAVSLHRRQPLYFYLGLYLASDGWMVSSVNAHTTRSEVFPDWLLAGVEY